MPKENEKKQSPKNSKMNLHILEAFPEAFLHEFPEDEHPMEFLVKFSKELLEISFDEFPEECLKVRKYFTTTLWYV